MSANLIVGKDPDGNKVPVAVDATGQLKIVGGGGGGGSTDMTVANAQLTAINANTDGLEGKADTSNGILTTTAADIATIKDEAILIDAKLPDLSSGRIPVVSQTPTITASYGPQAGVIATGTILIDPIVTTQLRTISVQTASLGTGGTIVAELSNNGTTWTTLPGQTTSGASAPSNISAAGIHYYQTYGANFFRLRLSQATTGGTTTLFVCGGVEVYPQNHQSVTVTGQVSTSPAAAGTGSGFQIYHSLVSAASTNATSVKAITGVIGSLVLTNTSDSFKYVKFYNLGTAPTVGTSTPIIQFPIPPSTTLDVSTSYLGARFAPGIAYAITGGAALLDTTAVGAGEVLVNLSYA